ncbi:UDP-N-acetylglucosamine transferase subunit alg14 [Penicillium argentinense]|uniref:UDP-N-acetylglucosamine transferase subunit ALG14 n=1 Tax=Penicillium argentinense TaxID=1131581 RepID=A0A9W9JXU1_9EURO|nr:UDP-N-acetylglucosamine transferase subunit alg14 [Penicillium argentinense]KAJ5085543.1 UDP-N-acetylglucosamine transferase subunit alg14 [Penicillium argentinense]
MAFSIDVFWGIFWQIVAPVAALGLLAITIILASLFISHNAKLSKVRRRGGPVHVLIVLGSGGHTTEMLYMLNKTAFNTSLWTYRTYVTTSGDNFSARKAAEFEAQVGGKATKQTSPKEDATSSIATHNMFQRGSHPGEKDEKTAPTTKNPAEDKFPTSGESFRIIEVPRARRVHQSYLTAPFSTLHCFWACLLILTGRSPSHQSLPQTLETALPDIIISNGPAVAVCMIIAAKFLRFFIFVSRWLTGRGFSPEIARLRTIYVESWARVRHLSVSGKLLLPFADLFIVQWRPLEGLRAWWGMKRTEHKGWLVI